MVVPEEVEDAVGEEELHLAVQRVLPLSRLAGGVRDVDGDVAEDDAAVVATDGHRLFVDGDARDCPDAKFVFQVPGDDWKPATKALATSIDAVRLLRIAIPVMLAFCMARPVLTGRSALLGGGKSSVVLLLDNSYSMNGVAAGLLLRLGLPRRNA